MQNKQSVMIRFWGALFLLLLLLSIQAVQSFHTHPSSIVTHNPGMSAGGSIVSYEEPCAVCDFDFLRQANVMGPFILQANEYYPQASYACLHERFLSRFFIRRSSRAPPAFLSF